MEQINMENKSMLKMYDLYFAEINFKQNKNGVGNFSFSIDHKINHFDNADNPSRKMVEIITNVYEPAGRINIALKTIGVFEINDPDGKLDQKMKEALINKNTISIMFPFIRSQIALISAQPGLSTIMIPVIDVNALIDGKKD